MSIDESSSTSFAIVHAIAAAGRRETVDNEFLRGSDPRAVQPNAYVLKDPAVGY